MEHAGNENLSLEQQIANKEQEIRNLQQYIADVVSRGGQVDSHTFDILDLLQAELQNLMRKSNRKK